MRTASTASTHLARVALAALVVCGCAYYVAPLYEEIVPTRVPDAAYELLYPRYVELCAVSQYRPRNGRLGGMPGHAVLYIKGACLDEEAPFPQLRPCGEVQNDWRSPRHGAGVSVNRWFRNVNWIATPGRMLFYNGDLEPFDRLDRAHFEATVQRAIALGMFRGVELWDYPTPSAERSLEDFVRHHSLGTDFALRFGRSVFCTTLPITEGMLVDVVEYLNGLNREYATGHADYEWDGYHDNCVHTVRNALAAADVWKPKSVNVIKLRQLFHLAIPANEFVELSWLGTRFPVGDFDRVYRDAVQRRSLVERDWLPTRHGVLVQSAGVHPFNDLYDTRFRMFVLDRPFGSGATKRAEILLNDARFTQIDANLFYFQRVYRRILEEREREEYVPDPGGSEERRARQRYYAYVERQLAEVEGMLARLAGIERRRYEEELR